MPIKVRTTAGATAYGDIRAGAYNNVRQLKLDISNLFAAVDAQGYLPVGLPIEADGTTVDADLGTLVGGGLLGPEAVGPFPADTEADVFANVITSGQVNQDMIEDNLGRALTAFELTALAAAKGITLVT
jgi:hypothetical protein